MSPIQPTDPESPDARPVVAGSAAPGAATGWRRGAELVYVGLAGLFILSVFVQFFLAGLGVFGAESYNAHKDFGGVIHLASFLLFILALLVRRNRIDLGLTFTMFVLATLQFTFAQADNGHVAAFHVVNALLIYTIAFHLFQRAMRSLRAT